MLEFFLPVWLFWILRSKKKNIKLTKFVPNFLNLGGVMCSNTTSQFFSVTVILSQTFSTNLKI